MGIITSLIEKHKRKKQEINLHCDELISEIGKFKSDAKLLFADASAFISPEQASAFKNRCFQTKENCSKYSMIIYKAEHYASYEKAYKDLTELSREFDSLVQRHNNYAAELKAREIYELIGDVEGKQLDRQQFSCIAKDVHNHLVIAGAGTGKTTTIVGKIKYLIRSNKCRPEDILVLSFTNASATEMCERIRKETDCDIAASTFHKLGLNIIASVDGKKPAITDLKVRRFIKEKMSQCMNDPVYLKKLVKYIHFGRTAYRSEFEFNSQKEYNEYLKLNPPVTINHETVKSYGEMDIANFLFINGIRYEYEKAYEFDTANEKYGQYHPDFYLPDHDIYIEYFGIDSNNEVPSYFKAETGMTPSQTYLAGMSWKRETHKKNGTVMIECYAYEKYQGILLDELRAKLESKGVALNEKTPQEMWSQISDNDCILNGIYELFETCIILIKSNDYSIEYVRQLNAARLHRSNVELILDLLEPIYDSYCSYLSEHSQIDFNDMINLAARYVEEGKYTNPYKYVIVDEYQDIARSRYRLLASLRKSMDYDLFCVGDDWQSIYQFAGSDIGFIFDFEKYWGKSEISKIETTYRFPQKLIEISGTFIMADPMQIRKNIRGVSNGIGFPLGEINAYTDKKAIEFMIGRLDELPKDSTVFFIGRYAFDKDLLNSEPKLECRYNNAEQRLDVFYRKRPDLKMCFITAHRSKGLQADYVFILNNKNSKMGFPSKIQDSAILDLLLESRDNYRYAEERRLFYVALTRAKKKAYLLTVSDHESEFVSELRVNYGTEMKNERFECPLCGGRLVKRKGPYSEFYGCSNYKDLNCRFIRKI